MKIIEKSTILLPDMGTDLYSYAVVACDQFTSNPEYWSEVERLAENKPSTAHIVLPEIYLNTEQEKHRLRNLSELSRRYSQRLLNRRIDGAIAVERTLADGAVRRGLVVSVDLDCYAFDGGKADILPTEKTILSRIPARCEARRLSALECPHIIMLLDNPGKDIIEPLFDLELPLLYTTRLQQGGGSIKGYELNNDDVFSDLQNKITRLYVGDGNHSLAAAKTLYEELKKELGEKEAAKHPARYCLVEIVNLYSEALPVLPIHRVLFSVSEADVMTYSGEVLGKGDGVLYMLTPSGDLELSYDENKYPLAVLAADAVCEAVAMHHNQSEIDYIHGDEELRELCTNAIGFLMPTPDKSQLLPYIEKNGVFPKKYFSLGHGADKRYYLECRNIIQQG